MSNPKKTTSNPSKKPRKKPFAATNSSRKLLESQGWTVGVVEQTIPHTFIKRDFLGFADLVCCSPSMGILAVQVTGGGHLSDRAEKIRQEPRAAIWLASGGRIQVHDWRKRAGQKERENVRLELTIQIAQ